jgi:[Skp1-protein]-hydroxyproline N-acetylglucosaminyltransferase
MWYYSDPNAAVSTTTGALQSLSLAAPTTDSNNSANSGASQQPAATSSSSNSSSTVSRSEQLQQQQQQSTAAATTTSSNISSSTTGSSSGSGSSSSDASADTRAQVTPLPLPAAPDLSSRIFVSIVSYRDPEVGPTVADCLSRAAAPARIRIGCVLQTTPGDVGCDVSSDISSSGSGSDTTSSSSGSSGSSGNSGNSSSSSTTASTATATAASSAATSGGNGSVRVLRLSAAEAAGPCWARRLAASLWRGEPFTLQIDSHMRFRPNWDVYLLHELSLCDSPRPILTSYPSGYELPQRVPYTLEHTRGTLLCPAGFGPAGGDGMLRQRGRRFNRSNASVTATAVTATASSNSSAASSSSASSSGPLKSPLWAAGFNFGASTALQEHVQYDPYMRHVFFGEEISMAARLYTHGYDFFAPAQAVVYHLWSRGHRPRYVQTNRAISACTI